MMNRGHYNFKLSLMPIRNELPRVLANCFANVLHSLPELFRNIPRVRFSRVYISGFSLKSHCLLPDSIACLSSIYATQYYSFYNYKFSNRKYENY